MKTRLLIALALIGLMSGSANAQRVIIQGGVVRSATLALMGPSNSYMGVSLVDGAYAVADGFPPAPNQSLTGQRTGACVSFYRRSATVAYFGSGCVTSLTVAIDPALAVASASGSGKILISKYSIAKVCNVETYTFVSKANTAFSAAGLQISGTGTPSPSSAFQVSLTPQDDELHAELFATPAAPDASATQSDPSARTRTFGYTSSDAGFSGYPRSYDAIAFSQGFNRPGAVSGGTVTVTGHGTFATAYNAYLASGTGVSLVYER
jgi:hypothetical protein